MNEGIMMGYTVKVQSKFIEPFMDKMGVTPDRVFPVVGIMEDRLLLEVDGRFLEMYPRKVEVVKSPVSEK